MIPKTPALHYFYIIIIMQSYSIQCQRKYELFLKALLYPNIISNFPFDRDFVGKFSNIKMFNLVALIKKFNLIARKDSSNQNWAGSPSPPAQFKNPNIGVNSSGTQIFLIGLKIF
jgi:hypothetical protein